VLIGTSAQLRTANNIMNIVMAGQNIFSNKEHRYGWAKHISTKENRNSQVKYFMYQRTSLWLG